MSEQETTEAHEMLVTLPLEITRQPGRAGKIHVSERIGTFEDDDGTKGVIDGDMSGNGGITVTLDGGYAYRLEFGSLVERLCYSHKRRLKLEAVFGPAWEESVRETAERVCNEPYAGLPPDVVAELVRVCRAVSMTAGTRWSGDRIRFLRELADDALTKVREATR